jgi:5-formyltetrahydrofolate cyclo-ligase
MEYTKKALRKYVKEYRSGIKAEEKAIWDKGLLANLQPFHLEKEKVVYAYISVNGEAETGPLIEKLLSAGVRVAVPLVVKTSTDKWLDFYYITGPDDLEPGVFGLLEPKKTCRRAMDKNCPVIVPGVAFTREGGRSGYGGGFYDTFLAKFDGVSVGLCREAQFSDDLRSEGIIDAHDLPAQLVVTENRILRR